MSIQVLEPGVFTRQCYAAEYDKVELQQSHTGPRVSTFCLRCDKMLSDVTARDKNSQTFPYTLAHWKQ